MALTIYDIAKMAGTSVSTVSRYLNNKSIRNDNKLKIEKVLEENEFVPNEMARALVSKSLKTVAIITVDIRVPHYSITAYTIEQEFTKKGYNVIICNTSGNVSDSLTYIKNLTKKQIDGIVFVGSIFNDLNNNLEALRLLGNLPVVVANGQINSLNSYSVLMDDVYGVEMAYDYLKKKGRKNIVYIQDLDTYSANLKKKGFTNSLDKENLSYDGKIYKTTHNVEGGIRVVDEILSSKEKVDAIITGEDLVAVGVINNLKKHGIIVGKDIDVIGYGHSIYNFLTDPVMTSVDNKPVLQATYLVDLLEKLILGQNVGTIVLRPEMFKGDSA